MKLPRHAFTLVELLVVIAIIGILIGLMLPAVGAMHEAGRRATCQGRMARIGLALQKREAAYGALPAGTTDPKGPIHNIPQGIQISWTVHLLPYLDEASTLKYIDLEAGAYAAKNELARKMVIPAFVCPSQVAVASIAAPASSYAGCHHDVEQPINDDNHGVLFLNSHMSERDVTDGVEHTIYVGEKLVDEGDLGWMSGSRATLRNAGTPINATPTELPSSRPIKKPVSRPVKKSAEDSPPPEPGEAGPLPPRAPGDSPPPEPEEAAPNPRASDLYVGGFGSNHPSGATFLFGDRAVKFVNRDIDKEIFRRLAHRADGQLITSGPTRE
jgi:prepilin-type N-terminal cleavage/methylation domain-containing protein